MVLVKIITPATMNRMLSANCAGGNFVLYTK